MSSTDPTTETTQIITDPEVESPARKVGIGYLVTGLLFLGIVALWWLTTQDVIAWTDLSLAGPVVLIAAGGLGLAASVFNRSKEGN